MKRNHYRIAALCSMAAVVSLAGCGGDDTVEITEKRVVTQPAQAAGGEGSTAARLGMQAPAQASSATPAYAWDKPEGWQDAPTSAMRPANFKAGANGEVECYLSVLSGTGGGLLANVNRWRTQMSLAEIGQAEFEALPSVELGGKKAVLVELDGAYKGMQDAVSIPEAKMIGAILEDAGHTLFVKMTGPKAAVEAERERFVAFCTSLRPGSPAPAATGVAETMPDDEIHAGVRSRRKTEDAQMPDDAVHAGIGQSDAAAPASSLTWTTPEGWAVAPAKPMRDVTFVVGPSGEAECFITVLPMDGGGLAANVNRWRKQMAQGELDEAAIAALPKLEVLGSEATLVEITGSFTGMDGSTKEGQMMLGLIWMSENESIYVKMTGPEAVVQSQKAAFETFCKSLGRK